MVLLEFMCDIEHIPGKTNIIADCFSSFVHFPKKEEKNIEREEIDLSETFLAGHLLIRLNYLKNITI
jgi:hypothetical protein